MGEFLFEGFVHVLLEVGGFDVFDDRGLKRKTNAQAVTTRTHFQHPERRPDPSNTHKCWVAPPQRGSGDQLNVGQKERQNRKRPFTSSCKCAGTKPMDNNSNQLL